MGDDAQELVGTWKVSFRHWTWEYVFSSDKKVRWRDPLNNENGSGHWMKTGQNINIAWTASSTKESWRCPIDSDNQDGWYDASYGVGKFQAKKTTVQGTPLAGLPVDPAIANVPWSQYVDQFSACKYDVNYKIPKDKSFAFSSILQLRYDDGASLEIDIDDLTGQALNSEAARNAMAAGFLGEGRRIFPRIMAANTVPRLSVARSEALAIQRENESVFAKIALSGLAVVLTVPAMPAGAIDPTSVARTRATRTRVAGAPRPGGVPPGINASVRPRATPSQLRQMLNEPDNVYVWATFDESVAANQPIRFTGKTNQGASQGVHLLKGRNALTGSKYGPNKVAIDGSKFRNIRELPGRADEFILLDEEIGAAEGLWFTNSDLAKP